MEEKLIEMLVQALPDDALDDFSNLLDKENLTEEEISNFLRAHNVDINKIIAKYKEENK